MSTNAVLTGRTNLFFLQTFCVKEICVRFVNLYKYFNTNTAKNSLKNEEEHCIGM